MCIKDNYTIVKALETTLETRLKQCHGIEFVNLIMDQIKLIEEHCVELGIDATRNNGDQKLKENLWNARRSRENE